MRPVIPGLNNRAYACDRAVDPFSLHEILSSVPDLFFIGAGHAPRDFEKRAHGGTELRITLHAFDGFGLGCEGCVE